MTAKMPFCFKFHHPALAPPPGDDRKALETAFEAAGDGAHFRRAVRAKAARGGWRDDLIAV
jgi:hypothetical protein